ncbi:MAG: NAD(P)/FAD-dependent oxidoreductase, partial [Halobacteriaceae archaeon]
MEQVDVAIVGGGPAGSSAARAAAEQGASPVLIEQGVPRDDRKELGPDSTDAAGLLDYWFDVMDLDPEMVPEDVVLRELESATFIGPTERLEIETTGQESRYEGFGITFHRARFDDWLRERAETAGADYRVGTGVRSVSSDCSGHENQHVLQLNDGSEIQTESLILADGPQRRVTMNVLDQFLPSKAASERLSPPRANHIAYQEYRRFPEELFDPDSIIFWWGWMPGETAYPWVFPNEDTVARVGLTLPMALDIDEFDRNAYRLLRDEDESIPSGSTYIERLLEAAYPEYEVGDFPIVDDHGKSGGTETYPISSTRPIDSPTGAGIAVAGGAMGSTSA